MLNDGKENIFNNAENKTAKMLESQRLAENERLKGNECVKAKSYTEAVESYSRSLELDPDQPYTYANRAMAYLKQKLYKHALEDAEKAIKMKPDYLKAYHRRGKALAALERYAEAIKDFQFLLEKEPENKEINKELKDARMLLTNQTKVKEMAEKDADPVIEEINDEDEQLKFMEEAAGVKKPKADDKKTKPKEQPKKAKGFVSVNIEESESEEEEVKPRDSVTVKTIESKFPLKYQSDIDQHAIWAKELMKKGSDDFKIKLAEADKARENARKNPEPAQKDFEKVDNSSGKDSKIQEVTKKVSAKDAAKNAETKKKAKQQEDRIKSMAEEAQRKAKESIEKQQQIAKELAEKKRLLAKAQAEAE